MTKFEGVEIALDIQARVGECPVWSVDEGALYWVDTLSQTLNRFDLADSINRAWPVPEPIGSFALMSDTGIPCSRFLVALQSGFYIFDVVAGVLELLVDPETEYPANRLNDGRCDPAGRFWCGSMTPGNDGSVRAASLYRLNPDGNCSAKITGLGTSNGLAFSPDGRSLYHSDSLGSVAVIWRADFDCAEGEIGRREVLFDCRNLPGRPDGAAMDADGCYWSAMVDGGELLRFTPDGRIDRRIALPVSKPSMPAFGGRDLATLFVTSISVGTHPEVEPNAGAILAIDVGVSGVIEPRFEGDFRRKLRSPVRRAT